MTDPTAILAQKIIDRYGVEHFDTIVGIPRGGLIVAANLGYWLGIANVAAFGVEYRRARKIDLGRIFALPVLRHDERLLIVEDSCLTGTLIENARRQLASERREIVTVALWVSPAFSYRPDLWAVETEHPPNGRDLLRCLDHVAP